MAVTAISQSKTLSGKLSIFKDTILDEISTVHDEASPTLKRMWDDREDKNFTNDTIFQVVDYAMAPGGIMRRNHTFTQETTENFISAQFTAKVAEAHEAINWFEIQESMSDDAIYDLTEDKINRAWKSLWYRLSYMLWSKQDETVPGTGVIDGNTKYTTLLPDIEIGGLTAATDQWDGLPMAIRGHTAEHTYAGITVTTTTTDQAWWAAHVSNGTSATDDHGASGTARVVTDTIIDDHIGGYSRGGKTNAYGAMSHKVFTAYSRAIRAKMLWQGNQAVTMNAYGVEDPIVYRGTEYYYDPWCDDVHYDSTEGGSVFGWDPSRFCLMLHSSSRDPVIASEIANSGDVKGFEKIPNSTVFMFSVFLWGNFITKARKRLDRINNLKY